MGRETNPEGDTFKNKISTEESVLNDKGEAIGVKRTQTDCFIPTIHALDFTHGSPTFGLPLTIR